jgi:ATP-dependent Lon protease
MVEKLKNLFDEMVVYKDLKKSNFFSALSLPSFMRDWLLKKFEDENGQFNSDELLRFVQTYLPHKDDWIAIKNKIIVDRERVKFLAKVSVDIDIKTSEVSFALPDFGLTSRDTIIEDSVWQICNEELVRGRETWGMIELGYREPVEDPKIPGKIKLTGFKTFCPYTIDLDYYKTVRNEFSINEWLDILLGAVDYNSDGYLGDEEKKSLCLHGFYHSLKKG